MKKPVSVYEALNKLDDILFDSKNLGKLKSNEVDKYLEFLEKTKKLMQEQIIEINCILKERKAYLKLIKSEKSVREVEEVLKKVESQAGRWEKKMNNSKSEKIFNKYKEMFRERKIYAKNLREELRERRSKLK